MEFCIWKNCWKSCCFKEKLLPICHHVLMQHCTTEKTILTNLPQRAAFRNFLGVYWLIMLFLIVPRPMEPSKVTDHCVVVLVGIGELSGLPADQHRRLWAIGYIWLLFFLNFLPLHVLLFFYAWIFFLLAVTHWVISRLVSSLFSEQYHLFVMYSFPSRFLYTTFFDYFSLKYTL